MSKSWFKIMAGAKKGTTQIEIYDEIGAWGVTAANFMNELKAIEAEEINLRLNSEGGAVFDGIPIYNALKRHSARVVVDVDGLAASIASVIAMAGDEIRMAGNAFMMIHDPWIYAMGTADELRKTADTMDSVRDKLLDAYDGREGTDREEISDFMTQETWMTAEEALDAGLIDTITDELQIAAKVHPERYRHVPEEVLNKGTPRLDAVRKEINTHLSTRVTSFT